MAAPEIDTSAKYKGIVIKNKGFGYIATQIDIILTLDTGMHGY